MSFDTRLQHETLTGHGKTSIVNTVKGNKVSHEETIPADGKCGCMICTPDIFLSGERQSEDHLAARFGDMGTPRASHTEVTLNGEKVIAVYETLPGNPGTIISYHIDDPVLGLPHLCTCGSREYCSLVQTGDVQSRLLAEVQ